MSWDSYISDHLMAALPNSGGKTLSHAAIIGLDGGIWAKDANFPNLTPDQIANVVKGFDDADALSTEGLKIGDVKYLVVQGEAGAVIRGRQGDTGVCIKKTATAFVVGIYGPGVQAGDCNVLVEGLGDYLKEMGV
jgi:profilin